MSPMRLAGVAYLLLIVAQIAPQNARAQQPQLGAGARVRLTVPRESADRLVGTIATIGKGGLTLEVQSGTPLDLPFTSVSKLEISTRPADRMNGFWKGAGIGFLIGGAAGVVIGLVAGDDEPDFVSFSAADKALIAGIGLGTLGALLGGAIGAASGRERWEEVAEPFSDWGFRALPGLHRGLSLELSGRF